jgi:outer membrane scaffolding protein for murein synthesis (MipA/OmpV family)
MKCSTCSGTSFADARRRRRAVPGALARLLALALAFGAPVGALAQSVLPDLSFIGAAVRTRPAYDGSESQQTDLIPMVRYFGKTWFARTTQGVLEGGARVGFAPALYLGAQIAYEEGRAANESEFLSRYGVPDIRPAASFGLHLEWDTKVGPVPITLLARGRQIADADRGAQADLRLTAGVYGGKGFLVAVFAQGTWANAKSAQFFYGMTQEQSAETDLPAFEADSGPLSTGFGLLWSYDLSREWMLVGSLNGKTLHGSAARSPLAERTSNAYASAGLAYRF